MTSPFVPTEFDIPLTFEGPEFRMEPLGGDHNQRDYDAWMSSIDHIKSTPGFAGKDWPEPMSLEANLSDLVGHATDFEERRGFTYSILDGDEVIGCVYIYPAPGTGHGASVSSWVRKDRAELDRVTWKAISDWLATSWPFASIDYAARR